jgi:hypothetical protein
MIHCRARYYAVREHPVESKCISVFELGGRTWMRDYFYGDGK